MIPLIHYTEQTSKQIKLILHSIIIEMSCQHAHKMAIQIDVVRVGNIIIFPVFDAPHRALTYPKKETLFDRFTEACQPKPRCFVNIY